MKFQTQFNHNKSEPFVCDTPSMTEQQFEFETNINNVVKGCVQSSLPAQQSQALYGLSITGDEFEKNLNANQEVLNYFEELPASAKDYFHYNPKNMLDFIKNSDNFEKAYEIGLIDKKTYTARKEAFTFEKNQKLIQEQNASSEVISSPEINPNSEG